MKKALRAALSLVLAISLAIGCLSISAFAANGSQGITPSGYVTIDVEKFTLGQGYLKEPTAVPFYEGDSVGSVLLRWLGESNYQGSAYYISAIRDSGTGAVEIPKYITDGIQDYNASVADSNYKIKQSVRKDSGWLEQMDYYSWSGWMFCQNNVMPDVGASSCTPKDGDVIRFQFSLSGGSDLGLALSYGAPYITAANKDTLTAQLAKVNSSGYKSGFLSSSYAKTYSDAVKTAENMKAAQMETDTAASSLANAYGQYLANLNSGSGGNHHNSGSGNSSGATGSTASSSVSTVLTSSTPTGGSISTVSTLPDTTPVLNGNQSNISVTVPSDVASVLSAATAEKPAEIRITTPSASMIDQLNSSAVKVIDLAIKVPAAVANNTNANAKITISADPAVLQAAKDAQKDITIQITNADTGKEIYSWAFSGTGLARSAAPVTNLNLALQVGAVKDDMAAASAAAGNSADKKATGVVLKFGSNGLLPAPAKIRVYVGSQPGCNPKSKVYFYYLNSTTQALEQMPQSEYTVDADGYVTVIITHCSDYVLLPHAATNPYPVQSDTVYPVGVKQKKAYTYAMTVSGKAAPSFTIGNNKAFTASVKRSGNKYYVTVKATGTPGVMTAVYSTLPGQKPTALCYIAIIK